jgi:hypothetical protein
MMSLVKSLPATSHDPDQFMALIPSGCLRGLLGAKPVDLRAVHDSYSTD